jgi:hypothetical protein
MRPRLRGAPRRNGAISKPAAAAYRPPAHQERAKAFYDTGEHVLAGEDLQELAGHEKVIKDVMTNLLLEVGKPDSAGNSVGFTYGELITMGDLYDSFDEMDAAPAAELLRLRTFIRKSRDHYSKRIHGKGAGAANPRHKDWQDATDRRYVKLALENFAHFAPSDSALTAAGKRDRGDHRRAWETYHERALNLVRAERTDQALHDALAINAFGDHFLTDAFSAGHLFNKADVAARFNAGIMDATGRLNDEGKRFFEAVAKAAFKGPLKEAFEKHETADKRGEKVGGWILFPHHANIDSDERFETFLKEVHAAEPDLIGLSIVAKVIHDKLNEWKGGVMVTNNAGDKDWPLTGDGTLNDDTLRIMRKAVARSIYNVVQEALEVPNDNALFDFVWQYTPRPTAQSKRIIKQLIDTYTTPTLLVPEAVAFLQEPDHFWLILEEAIRRGKLQHE